MWFKKMIDAAKLELSKVGKSQVSKRQTRYNYRAGPMFFLGQQIVKLMEDSGYPAVIHCHFRSQSDQDRAFARKLSKARAWQSPHQYGEAVDIVHSKLFWNAPPAFWQTLGAAVKVVEERFKVDLLHGLDWGWDSAHVELKGWRDFRALIGHVVPSQEQLDARFSAVLPRIFANYIKAQNAKTLGI